MGSITPAQMVPLLMALGWAWQPAPAQSAGRIPYGGTLEVPMRTFTGIHDPHLATTPSGRLGARFTHCHLLRRTPQGRVEGELAKDSGTFKGNTLTLDLRRGPTFHDGKHIGTRAVQKSLRRFASVGASPWLKQLVAALRMKRTSGHTLEIEAPGRRPSQRVLSELLARPELAVVRRSRGGGITGCGPWRVIEQEANSMQLQSFEGTPRGRPWIKHLTLRRYPTAQREADAFRLKSLDFTGVRSPRYRSQASLSTRAYTSIFLVPARWLRGLKETAKRHAIARAVETSAGELRSRVDSLKVLDPPAGIWPQALSPSRIKRARSKRGKLQRDLVLHFPAGDEEMSLLAATLRSTLERELGVSVRRFEEEGLSAERASSARRPAWDLALVRIDWAAHTKEQAAFEASVRLGLEPIRIVHFFAGATSVWASKQNTRLPVIPVLHLERALFHKGRGHLVLGPEHPALSDSWISE